MAVAPPSTSAGLLARLTLPDDPAAWERFVACYRPYTEFTCRRHGLQPADVDEVTGRVLAAMARTLPRLRYDPARRFRGYLTQVVANAVRSYWAETARRPGAVGAGGPDDPLAGVSSADGLAADLDDRLRADLARLDRALAAVRGRVRPDTWQVFARTALHGEDAAAVAADMGKAVATVYMAKSRTLALVRAELDRPNADPPESEPWPPTPARRPNASTGS